MIDQLLSQYEAVTAAAGVPPGDPDMTVVFDAGQNSAANFAHLAGTRLHYIGSVPASNLPDLTALPASERIIVDKERFGGLTAFDTRREVYGAQRRAILTHSPELHESQARGFDSTTLAKAGRNWTSWPPPWHAARPAAARTRSRLRSRRSPASPGCGGSSPWQLAGGQPKDLRLTWSIDPAARAGLEEEIFGKHVLITDHDDWPAAGVIAGDRSQSEAEFSFRQMKDPHVVSFSPMHHWTEHNIRVHVFTCVLALQIAHLMRLRAARAGLRMSVRELLRGARRHQRDRPALPSRPPACRAHRMLTETSPVRGQAHRHLQPRPATPPDAENGQEQRNHPRNHS